MSSFYNRNATLSEASKETGYKFDARLRYVENLLNSWILFVQNESDRKCKNLPTNQILNWKSNLYTLYFMLALHDDSLKNPDTERIDEDYVKKLVNHPIIKEVTDNRLKFKSWEEEVDQDY